MGIREDLIGSAVTFLQDPSVANAPLEKRIAFLQSKNLTQEEIDASLSRAENAAPQATAQHSSPYGYQNQQVVQQQQPFGYRPFQQGGYWQQQQHPPPPPVPRRDWRDYFIMATLMSGLSYGIYFVAKRYIYPMIAPPTPPQLEQDKLAVDESFNRAFDLIDQLSRDTAAMKVSEEVRKERLDSALSDFENAIQELKDASKRRDEDTRRIGDEVRNLQNMIPKAMKQQEENADERLRDLNSELKSLKTLLGNRMGGPAGNNTQQKSAPMLNGAGPNQSSTVGPGINGSATGNAAGGSSDTSHVTNSPVPDSSNTSSPYGRFTSGKGGIPAWQMAASKKNESERSANRDIPETSTTDRAASS